MPFDRSQLSQHEELVLDLRPHWIALAGPALILAGTIAFGIAVVAVITDPPDALLIFALILLVAALVWFGLRMLGWSMTMFVLTTDRVLTRRGVLRKSGVEIPLERINTVFFNQGMFERMVGAGDLAIESAGERGTERFSNVRKPAVVQREIYVQMEDNENRKFDRVSRPAASISSAEQLEKLHELMMKGALTPEQFEAEKAKLLGS